MKGERMKFGNDWWRSAGGTDSQGAAAFILRKTFELIQRESASNV